MKLRNSRRAFLIGAAATTVGVGLKGIPQAWAATPLSYGETEGQHWMVPYVASAKNTWRDAGLDVNTHVFPTGRVGIDAMLAGKLDVCICTDTPYVYAAMRGLKPRLVSPFSFTSKGSQIAVLTDRIKSPADLNGKAVATLMGGGGHYFLTRFLAAHHVTPNAVRIVNMQPNNMVIALTRGDVDALCWDPLTVRTAIVQGGGKVGLLDTSDSASYFRQYCLMIGNEAFVAAHPDACDAIVAALQAAIVSIQKDPAQAIQIMSARSKITTKQSEEAMADFVREIKFDDTLLNALVSQSEWAIENKLAVRPPQDLHKLYLDSFYLDGARKAIPGAVSVKL